MSDRFALEIGKLASSQALYPKESMLAVENRRRSLYIGIPKESSFQENRIGLTPDAV